MRICIVARVVPAHGIGGMQDHTADLARGLVAGGHVVELITARHPEGLCEEEVDGVRRHHVEASPDDFTSREWREHSYETFVRIDAEQSFDVVHGEGSSALELARRGTHRRTPLVVMFHGNFAGLVRASVQRQLRARSPRDFLREERGLVSLARRHFAKGNWRIFRDCEAIVPSRQQVADTCRSHRLDPARVHVVPNGVDTSVFRPRAQTEARAALDLPGGFLFICAGRLSHEKGVHHALRALALTRESAPDAGLLVVGDGAERRRLERLASDLGLDDRVVFTGAQPPEKMPTFLAAADAFLFPTERDEAAPLVLPQAMACGLPVVAARIGGITEVLGDSRRYGILIPLGDTEALADAMRELLREDGLRRQLGEAARERVLAEYTLERMVERTLDVYRIAIARLGPRS